VAPLSSWKEGLTNWTPSLINGCIHLEKKLQKVAADPLQTRITDYWKISDIENFQRLVNENRLLLQQFSTVENSESVSGNLY